MPPRGSGTLHRGIERLPVARPPAQIMRRCIACELEMIERIYELLLVPNMLLEVARDERVPSLQLTAVPERLRDARPPERDSGSESEDADERQYFRINPIHGDPLRM